VVTPAAPSEPGAAECARTVLTHAPTSILEVGADLTVVLDALAVDGSLVTVVDADGALSCHVAGFARSPFNGVPGGLACDGGRRGADVSGQAVIGTLRSALVSPRRG
jgi:hypothetical protein